MQLGSQVIEFCKDLQPEAACWNIWAGFTSDGNSKREIMFLQVTHCSFPLASLSFQSLQLYFSVLFYATSLNPTHLEIQSSTWTVLFGFCCDECLNSNAHDESEDLHKKKMSQTRETLVICSEPEHNRDVACASYTVNYSKHHSEVGTSFKRSFWWALFFFFFSPSSDKYIFNSVAELS